MKKHNLIALLLVGLISLISSFVSEFGKLILDTFQFKPKKPKRPYLYFGENTIYTPGAGGSPFGWQAGYPEASQYGQVSGNNPLEQNLIRKFIKSIIVDAAPEQFNALKVLFAKPFGEVTLDEHEYLEHTFGRQCLEANAISAQVTNPGAGQAATQTITLTAGGVNGVGLNFIIVYPDNTQAVVVDIDTAANTIDVESETDGSLPAVAVGDIFSIRSTIVGDGKAVLSAYERLNTITRFNFVQFFERACRWTAIEYQKFLNAGTTDYLAKDKAEKLRQLRTDMFGTYFNGIPAEFNTAEGIPAKSAGGLFPLMIGAGTANANPTIAGLKAAFEALAFQTNHKREGATRFIYATDEMCYEFSKMYKHPGLRYSPDNDIAKLNLTMIEFGTQKWVLVPCELFRSSSCVFPASWERRFLFIDQEMVEPVKMQGFEQMWMGQTLDRRNMGTREFFTDFWFMAQMSLRFHNPLGSFFIDVQ